MVLRVIRYEGERGRKGWVVNRTDKENRNSRIGGVKDTKKKAVKTARRVAKKNKPSKLYIEDMSGDTAKVRTYT